MNFIDEEDRALAIGGIFLRLLHDCTNLFDAARHGRKVDEASLRLPRNDACERRLADTWRPPEDHREDLVLGDELPKHFSLAHEVLLSHIIRKTFGAHPRRQRQINLAPKK